MVKKNNFINKINQQIGINIYELRLSKGLSRHKLAEQINVTQQQLQKYEYGKNSISTGRLLLIAKALNTNIEYFFLTPDKNINENTNNGINNSCLTILKHFNNIKDIKQQQAITTLVKSLID